MPMSADPTPVSDHGFHWPVPRAPRAPGSRAAAEEPLETTSVRLLQGTPICGAPVYVAEELLRAEGFTDIRYVETRERGVTDGDRARRDRFHHRFRDPAVSRRSMPAHRLTVLAGVHVGCFELFAQEDIRSIAELKGKSVGLRLSPSDLCVR